MIGTLKTPLKIALAAATFIAIPVLCTACASPWSTNKLNLNTTREPIPETTIEITADWNDIDAAMLIAASKSQLGLSDRTNDPDGAMFQFLTIHDETMLLWATPLEKPTEKPIRIKFEARLEPSRDTARESKFLQALTKRLTQLRGVDTAPVD